MCKKDTVNTVHDSRIVSVEQNWGQMGNGSLWSTRIIGSQRTGAWTTAVCASVKRTKRHTSHYITLGLEFAEHLQSVHLLLLLRRERAALVASSSSCTASCTHSQHRQAVCHTWVMPESLSIYEYSRDNRVLHRWNIKIISDFDLINLFSYNFWWEKSSKLTIKKLQVTVRKPV